MISQGNSVNATGQGACLSQLTQLLREEKCIHEDHDHTALQREGSKATSLVWRERVAQWCYDVVDHLHESRKLVFIAMNILDRFFVTCSACSSDRAFEAAALTALFLAVRIRGHHVLEVNDLVRMSRLGVTVREIVAVGKEMTRSLSFDRKLFTPADFVGEFLDLLQSSDTYGSRDVSSNAVYFTELCVVDSFFVGFKASEIALACVLLALENDSASLMDALISVPEHALSREIVSSLQIRINGIRKKTSGGLNVPHVIVDTDDGDENVMPHLNPPVRIVSQENLRMKRSSSCRTLVTLIESDDSSRTIKRQVSPHTQESTKRRRVVV